MSQNETKTAIRFRVVELKGKSLTCAYNFFLDRIGKPEDVEVNYKGVVDYFNYTDNFHVQQEGDDWFFDVVLESGDDSEHYFLMPFKKLFNLADEFAEKLGITDINDINIASYTWYNGVDEPFEFRWE